MPKLRRGPKRAPRVYLAEWRKAQDPELTLEEIGLRFDPPVDKAQISKWETAAKTGQISYRVVAEYAAALGQTYKDMQHHPDEGPSLDGMAEPLSAQAKEALRASIIAMGGRKAG